MLPWYRNQSTDLICKSINCFLCEGKIGRSDLSKESKLLLSLLHINSMQKSFWWRYWFRILMTFVRGFEPPSIGTPYMTIPSLNLFSQSPTFDIFRRYRPSEIQDKHKNRPIKESCFFRFWGLKNDIPCIFNKQHFQYTLTGWD